MKVGVIAEGDTLGSLVGEDFGHSPYFLIVDLDTYDYTVVHNEFSEKEMAGYKVAEAIASLGIPMGMVYTVVPIAGALICIYGVLNIIDLLNGTERRPQRDVKE